MPVVGNTPRPAYVYDTETDTWVPIGVGAHTHDDLYVNQNVIDAKGDLLVGTADNSYARLAKGADGTVLVSDNTTQTGLAWQPYAPTFVAGKNKLINGDFNINQRNFTSVTTDATYTFDRWRLGRSGAGTTTVTPQTFTPGSAPVSGYESRNYIQIVTSGQSGTAYSLLDQPIEDVRILAGQTFTYSFWGKVASGTAKVAVEFFQDFGSGGSTFNNIGGTNVTLTTSWARYSITYTIPSISGKTVGAGSHTVARIWLSASSEWNGNTGSIGLQSATFHIWGCQVEAGPIATPFTTHTGSIQGELAACQRYYWRQTTKSSNYSVVGNGFGASTANVRFQVKNPVQMRTEPSSIDFQGLYAYDGTNLIGSLSSVTLEYANESYLNFVTATAGGSFVANRPYSLLLTYPSAWIGASAEL